eukprot:TRINITY_DN36554_c0_g1_i1.p1 TRINITY_DN36554_c0_g1~~TRINITY_DN36554_c0_g1_i1.p1  ORF type:complete len:111 (-),score=12.77 TRINITY_DN36554_c0_g1_i1:43-375(-)
MRSHCLFMHEKASLHNNVLAHMYDIHLFIHPSHLVTSTLSHVKIIFLLFFTILLDSCTHTILLREEQQQSFEFEKRLVYARYGSVVYDSPSHPILVPILMVSLISFTIVR